MTEIWFDRSGQGVLVDGIRYHHRQRVPSCASCEHNLRLLVFKAMRQRVTDALRAARPEIEPAATTDMALEASRHMAKAFLEYFTKAASLLVAVGEPADAERTEPASAAMTKLRERVEREVRAMQPLSSLRATLLDILQNAREAVNQHEAGVTEGKVGANEIAQSRLAASWTASTYPKIRNALRAAEQSLG